VSRRGANTRTDGPPPPKCADDECMKALSRRRDRVDSGSQPSVNILSTPAIQISAVSLPVAASAVGFGDLAWFSTATVAVFVASIINHPTQYGCTIVYSELATVDDEIRIISVALE